MTITLKASPSDFAAAVAAATMLGMSIDYALSHPFASMTALAAYMKGNPTEQSAPAIQDGSK